MKSNRLTLTLCAAIGALAFGCGYPDMPAPDTSHDGPESDNDYGTDEEPIVVEAGVLSAIQASPIGFNYNDSASQQYFHECDSSNSTTVGLTKCRGHIDFIPAARSFNIATNNATMQQVLTTFCSQLDAKTGWSCSTSLFAGSTCPAGSMVCVKNQNATTTSFPVFDLRRYQLGACVSHGATLNTTFRSVAYQVQQCSQYTFLVDKAVISGEAGAQSGALLADVLYSVGLQSITVGMTHLNRDLADSATFSVGSNPYHARSHFLSNGQICRTNQYDPQNAGVTILDNAGCGND